MAETTVISVRGRRPEELLADPDFVYIGRGMPFQGWEASPFGNTFKPGDRALRGGEWRSSRDCVRAFERKLLGTYASLRDGGLRPDDPALSPLDRRFLGMIRRLPEIRGKRLGCWCGTWGPGQPEIPCHGVILAKAADAWIEGVTP